MHSEPVVTRRPRVLVFNPRLGFIVYLSQCSIFLYLFDSYSINNLSTTLQSVAYGFEAVVWVINALLSVSLFSRKRVPGQFDLLLLVSILFSVGLIVGGGAFESIRTFAQVLAYFPVILHFAESDLTDNIRMLRRLLVASIGFFILLDILNYVRSGNSLFSLGLIQAPLWIFGLLIVAVERGRNAVLLLLFALFFAVLYWHYRTSPDDGSMRLQYLPLGLSLLILSGFAVGALLRNAWVRGISLASIVMVSIVYFDTISNAFVFESRLGSYTERVYMFVAMASESFYFLVPQGLGASFHIYDLGRYNLNLGYRVLYPPHSAIAVLLYEYSFVGLLAIAYLAWSLLRRAIRSVPEGQTPDERVRSQDSLQESLRFRMYDRPLAKFLIALLCFVWLFQNVFYLKGVITADNFSDDGILIYFLTFVILYRLTLIERPKPAAASIPRGAKHVARVPASGPVQQ